MSGGGRRLAFWWLFRMLMPTRGGRSIVWSPLHFVHRKERTPPPSLDVFYGSCPTGTFDQSTSNSFASLWKKAVSKCPGRSQLAEPTNTHEVTGGQLSIRLCDSEYKCQVIQGRQVSQPWRWGWWGCQEASMENVGWDWVCGDWKLFF